MNKRLLLIVKTILILLLSWGSLGSLAQKQYIVTPEMFGAKGDGIADDSPALSKCLETGGTIRLSRGKVYVLHSHLSAIAGERLIIEGNDARLVIAVDYPLNQYESLFHFNPTIVRPKLMRVTNVTIACLLGQKFKDKQQIGDTFIFATSRCDVVKMSNVSFKCNSKYNNVTFLVSDGGDVTMDNCHIVLNTQSKQGGIFWMMNTYKKRVNISLKDSHFEYDTQDEAMCFSGHNTISIPQFEMNTIVKNCSFSSNGLTPSSGFIIVYNHKKGVFMNAHIQYENCIFETKGEYNRKIQAYQCGNDGGNYGIFKTKFKHCKFVFHPKRKSEGGVLSLLPVNNNIPRDHIIYDFDNCHFDLRNTSTLIGDKDGDKKGVYSFMKCSFISDASLFCKRYNNGNGQINIVVNGCQGISNDEALSSENLYLLNSQFINARGLQIYPQALTYTNKTMLRMENATLGKTKYAKIEQTGKFKVIVVPGKGRHEISLSSGDVLEGATEDGRDFNVYYYTKQQIFDILCVINDKKIPMEYIDKQGCYYRNVRMQQGIFRKGYNVLRLECDGDVLATLEFKIEE